MKKPPPALLIVLLGGLSIVLAGCASLSKDECLTADWQLIGYEDGLNGSYANRIGEHREACAKHGVTPNKNIYEQGYREGILSYCSFGLGLRSGQNGNSVLGVCPGDSDYHSGYTRGLESYCTYDVGYRQGLSGRTYRNVCSNGSEADFLSGYDFGKHIYSLQSSLSGLAGELENVIAQQDINEEDIERTKGRITYDETLTSEQRRDLLERLEEYSGLTVELAAKHVAIEFDMEQIRRELDDLSH